MKVSRCSGGGGPASPEIRCCSRVTVKSWRKSNPGRPLQLACARAKIVPAIGLHALRHSWASHAVMNGMPLMIVARNLGHVDTKMTEQHYAHLAPSYEVAAIRAHAPRFGLEEDDNIVPLVLRRRGRTTPHCAVALRRR